MLQLYADKLDNLEEMNKFLERYNLLILNQNETDNLNRLIINSEIEYVIKKKLSINQSAGLDSFTEKFYFTCKKSFYLNSQHIQKT